MKSYLFVEIVEYLGRAEVREDIAWKQKFENLWWQNRYIEQPGEIFELPDGNPLPIVPRISDSQFVGLWSCDEHRLVVNIVNNDLIDHMALLLLLLIDRHFDIVEGHLSFHFFTCRDISLFLQSWWLFHLYFAIK